MSDIITLERLLTSDFKYPERMTHPECTEEVKANAEILIPKINQLLSELGIETCEITSGFRTTESNKAIGGAKKSLHCQGKAVDLKDREGHLDRIVSENDELLKKLGLWQELPEKTDGWIHLDDKDRGKRIKNQFIP